MVKQFSSMLLLAAISLTLKAQSGEVLFKVSGIDLAEGGNLSSGLFKEENFPNVGEQFRGKDVKVSSTTMEILVEDVPVGIYGGVVFQDVNSNKELETNFVGFPTEPIGFANDAKIKFGPPDFEDAAVEVRANATTVVEIKL